MFSVLVLGLPELEQDYLQLRRNITLAVALAPFQRRYGGAEKGMGRGFGENMYYFVFCVFLATLRGMWDLSSQTRDGTSAPCSGS